MSRKARETGSGNAPSTARQGGGQGRTKPNNASSSKQRTKRPKPIDVQTLIDEALNKVPSTNLTANAQAANSGSVSVGTMSGISSSSIPALSLSITPFVPSFASEVIARSALQHIIDNSAKILFDHHVQRLAVDTTAINTVKSVFEATRLCALKHDVGELYSEFSSSGKDKLSKEENHMQELAKYDQNDESHSDFALNSDLGGATTKITTFNAGIARLRRIRMTWGDIPTNEEEEKYSLLQSSKEYLEKEKAKCTRSPVTPEIQSWTCEAPPPPCEEDRWSRGLTPLHHGQIASYHKPLNQKFSEALIRKQHVSAVLSKIAPTSRQNPDASISSNGTSSGSISPNTPTPTINRLRRRSSMSSSGQFLSDATAPTSPGSSPGSSTRPLSPYDKSILSAYQSGMVSTSALMPTSSSASAPTLYPALPGADLTSIRTAALNGTEIDLRNVPSDSVLFWKSNAESNVNMKQMQQSALSHARRRTSVSLSTGSGNSLTPQGNVRPLNSQGLPQTTSSKVPEAQPFMAPPLISQHKILEERLREVALKNLSDERKLKTLQSEIDMRLAGEAAKFSLFRTDLKDKEFTLDRTGAVRIVKSPSTLNPSRTRGNKLSSEDGYNRKNNEMNKKDDIPFGTPGVPSTCPTIAAVQVQVPSQGNTAMRSAHMDGGMKQTGRRTGSNKANMRHDFMSSKDPGLAAAVASSAASLRLLSSTVDVSAVQPTLSQVIQPVSGVTMKQGSVMKTGPKRFATATSVSSNQSPYAHMSKSQYQHLIQSMTPSNPALPLQSSKQLLDPKNVVVSGVSNDVIKRPFTFSEGQAKVDSASTHDKSVKEADAPSNSRITSNVERGAPMKLSPRKETAEQNEVNPVEYGYDPKGIRLQAKLREEAKASHRKMHEIIKMRQSELDEYRSASPLRNNRSELETHRNRSPKAVAEGLANEPGRGIVPYGKQAPIRTRDRKLPARDGHSSSTGILQTVSQGTGQFDHGLLSSTKNLTLTSSKNITLPYRNVVAGLNHRSFLSAQSELTVSSSLAMTGSNVLQSDKIVPTPLVKQYFGAQTVSANITGSVVKQI